VSLVKTRGLKFTYPMAKGEVLRGVDLKVESGELVLIIGSSGSGKSTLLKVLSGISPYLTGGTLAGEVRVLGKNMKRRRERNEVPGRVFYMPQEPEYYIIFRRAITEATVPYLEESSKLRQAELLGQKALRKWLPQISPNSHTATLSAGEKQRLVLSHLEASTSELYLLDEPMTHLDAEGRELFRRCLTEKVRQGGAAVIVTPSPEGYWELIQRANKVLLMEGGRIGPLPEPVHCVDNVRSWSRTPETPLEVRSPSPTKFKRSENPGGRLRLSGKSSRREVPQRGKSERYEVRKRCPIIEVHSLEVSCGNRELFTGLTFAIFEGEVFLIKGRNGSGKTTLIRTLLGFVKPQRGVLKAPWIGESGWRGGSGLKVGYLPQNPMDIFTCETLIEDLRLSWAKGRRSEPFSFASRKFIRALYLEGLEKEDPFNLSAGQRQRAAIASVLIGFPQITFLDEPTRGMDRKSYVALKRMLGELSPTTTIIISTHTDLFDSLGDKVLILDGGGEGV